MLESTVSRAYHTYRVLAADIAVDEIVVRVCANTQLKPENHLKSDAFTLSPCAIIVLKIPINVLRIALAVTDALAHEMVRQHDTAVSVLGARAHDLLGREFAAGARGHAVAMHFYLILILLGQRSYKLTYHKIPSFPGDTAIRQSRRTIRVGAAGKPQLCSSPG